MSQKSRRRPAKPTARIPAAVRSAYGELMDALGRADAQALHVAQSTGLSHERVLDLSEAGVLLNRYPQLASYLTGMKQREDARTLALQPDLRLKSPTGSTPQASPIASGWSGTKDTPNAVQNAKRLRELADQNPWVRAAINVRRQQIGRADIAVMPADPLKPYNKKLMKRVENLLNQPNEMRDSYRSLIEPVLEDILVLDRGVITKNMTPERKPVGLYYEDGATISIFASWNGNPKEYRYVYKPPANTGPDVYLYNDECIVFMANTATHRFGLSPVQVLYDTIMSDLSAARGARNMVENKPPPHLINVIGASPGQINMLRTAYEADLMGRKEMFFLGGPQEVKVSPLTQSARDNQWLEWQIFLLRKIAAVFQVSPQQLGVTFDINKSTGESQQQIYEDTGLIPLLLLIEEQLNRELLADFAPTLAEDRADLTSLNLRVVYPEVSETARQIHAERASDIAVKGMAGLPSMTLNQVLEMRGEQPVKGGNTFYFSSPRIGVFPWLSYDGGDTGDYTPPSTAGGIGSQDPAGGTAESSERDKASGKSTVPLPTENPANTPAAGKTSAKTTQSGDEPSFTGEYRRPYDSRQPGKNWLARTYQRGDEPYVSRE